MANFRIDLTDQNPEEGGYANVHMTLETLIQKVEGKPRVCAALGIASCGPWPISAAGLRRLARAATCMADEMEATELMPGKLAP